MSFGPMLQQFCMLCNHDVHYERFLQPRGRNLSSINTTALAIALPICLVAVIFFIAIGVYCWYKLKHKNEDAEPEPEAEVTEPATSNIEDHWYFKQNKQNKESAPSAPPPLAHKIVTDSPSPRKMSPIKQYQNVDGGNWGPARTVKPSKVVLNKPPPAPQLPVTLPRSKQNDCSPTPPECQYDQNNDVYEAWCQRSVEAKGGADPVDHRVPMDNTPPRSFQNPENFTTSPKTTPSPNFGHEACNEKSNVLIGDSFAASMPVQDAPHKNTWSKWPPRPTPSKSPGSRESNVSREEEATWKTSFTKAKNRITLGGAVAQNKPKKKGRLSLAPNFKTNNNNVPKTEKLSIDVSRNDSEAAMIEDDFIRKSLKKNDSPNESVKSTTSDAYGLRGWWDRITNRFSISNSTEALPSGSMIGNNEHVRKKPNVVNRRASAEFRVNPKRSTVGPFDFDLTDSVESVPATTKQDPPYRVPSQNVTQSAAKKKLREQLEKKQKHLPPKNLVHKAGAVEYSPDEVGGCLSAEGRRDALANSRVPLPFPDDIYSDEDPMTTPQPQRLNKMAPTLSPTGQVDIPIAFSDGNGNHMELNIQLKSVEGGLPKVHGLPPKPSRKSMPGRVRA